MADELTVRFSSTFGFFNTLLLQFGFFFTTHYIFKTLLS